MHLAHQVIQFIAENTPSPAPGAGGPKESFLDSAAKLLEAAGGFLAACGTIGGVALTYLSAKQLRRTSQLQNQQNSAPPPPTPPSSGGTA